MRHFLQTSAALCLLFVASSLASKSIAIPASMKSMDLTSSSSEWCYARSVQTDNWIIFWEAGFGSDPSTASGTYTVNMSTLETIAEKSFAVNQDSLKMVIKDSSYANKYKQIIFLYYTTEWTAYGSGTDDSIGTLSLDPSAASYSGVVAHEIGHIFQYLTGCDVSGGGYRWGFDTNGSGSNGFWEQCAQWQAWKTYPDQQFTDYDFDNYIKGTYLNFLHEDQRYANYFIPDYWTWKQGPYFMGKLWRSAKSPEDPVDTYRRLTGISQDSFGSEMYEHAARLTTWDLPKLKSYGAAYIDSRSQVSMSKTSDSWWLVDSANTPQNYGYNCIKLNPPMSASTVLVRFQGMAGNSGYRSVNVSQAGWRYGFVALLQDSTRVYGSTASVKYANGTNPSNNLAFAVPGNCSKLWLVVSGTPQEYWHHVWNDSTYDDEQWPYRVQFVNTNLIGQTNTTTKICNAAKAKAQLFAIHGGILELSEAATRLDIIDMRGRHICTLGATSGRSSISLTELPRGTLLVRAMTAGSDSPATSVLSNLEH